MNARQEAEADRRADEAFGRRVRVLMTAAGINAERLSALMGMSKTTLYERLKAPGSFRLQEIRRFRRLEKRFMGGGETEWDIGA